jgi:hypothetical protein
MSKKYLYGASVQGIQGFIFQTSKLAEIVGASELVEKICTKLFYDTANIDKDDKNIIISAAGNIKFIFDDKQKCEDFVSVFPKVVMASAPGITVSQAVVCIENTDFPTAMDSLERKLKNQRNKILAPTEIGFMGLERARRTGGVAYGDRKTRKGNVEVICEATAKKRAVVKSSKEETNTQTKETLFKKISGLTVNNCQICFDIEDMTKGNVNSWIAVIHADGNGLGNILQNMGNKLKDKDSAESKEAFRSFSKALENATQKAAQLAFEKIVDSELTAENRFPIRPVLCGGDDLTVIIRADLALNYTNEFLKAFETETASEFKILEKFDIVDYKAGITACAGIAYVKESYPLHYALHLAESLCGDAKKMVKENDLRQNGIPESALAFYKVQESFIEDLSTLKERTLKTSEGLDYYFGPYRLPDIEKLNQKLKTIEAEAEKNDKTKAAGKLRQIVSESYKDSSTALLMIERMKEINGPFFKELGLETELKSIKSIDNKNRKSQLLDLITLHSFNYGNRDNQ